MTTTTPTPTHARLTPRWKAIHGLLREELATCDYGGRFYTIAEICRKFDVSTTTSIRVLNELSNAGLVEKIPNKGNVVRQVNRKAAMHFLVPADAQSNFLMSEPIIRRITQGLRDAAEQQGIEFHSLCEQFLPNFTLQRDVPLGFLLPSQISRETVAFLRRRGVPHVFVNHDRASRQTANAHVDWKKSGYLATRHLLGLGHRRIAFVAGRIELGNARRRVIGYRDALREAGIPFEWSLIRQVVDPDGGRKEVTRRFGELMNLPQPPTAVLAATDYSAIYMLEECRRLGLDVPGDVSIVGYPNHPESSLTQPQLTVVDAHYEKVAQTAITLLLEQILNRADPARRHVSIEPELVVRASTAPPQSVSSASRSSLPRSQVMNHRTHIPRNAAANAITNACHD